MKLKSFGCSFIFGSDLADDGHTRPGSRPSQLTWPAHLARYWSRQYECYARPGSGNLQILERLLTQVACSTDKDFFIIGWSWIDRFDYYNPNYDPQSNIPAWSTIMPDTNTDLAKTYHRHLHSEYRDKFTVLSYIKLAIDTLNQQHIPFVMTHMDETLFESRWHISPAVVALQHYVRPYMTLFQGQTFLDWSRNHKYPESGKWHPLEAAHQAGFETIKSQCDAILHTV